MCNQVDGPVKASIAAPFVGGDSVARPLQCCPRLCTQPCGAQRSCPVRCAALHGCTRRLQCRVPSPLGWCPDVRVATARVGATIGAEPDVAADRAGARALAAPTLPSRTRRRGGRALSCPLHCMVTASVVSVPHLPPLRHTTVATFEWAALRGITWDGIGSAFWSRRCLRSRRGCCGVGPRRRCCKHSVTRYSAGFQGPGHYGRAGAAAQQMRLVRMPWAHSRALPGPGPSGSH